MNIQYYGVFFDDLPKELIDMCEKHERCSGNKDGYHVTFCYKPTENQVVPDSLWGTDVKVLVEGIMNGDGISALKVKIPDELKKYYHGAENSHITIYFGEKKDGTFAKPVEAGSIPEDCWTKLETSVEVQGKFDYIERNSFKKGEKTVEKMVEEVLGHSGLNNLNSNSKNLDENFEK